MLWSKYRIDKFCKEHKATAEYRRTGECVLSWTTRRGKRSHSMTVEVPIEHTYTTKKRLSKSSIYLDVVYKSTSIC